MFNVHFWNCIWAVADSSALWWYIYYIYIYITHRKGVTFCMGKMKSEHLHENGRCRSVSCTLLSLLARVVAPRVGNPIPGPCCMTQSRGLHPTLLHMGFKWQAVWIRVWISLLITLDVHVVTITFAAPWGIMALTKSQALNPAAVTGGAGKTAAWPSTGGCWVCFGPFCLQDSFEIL